MDLEPRGCDTVVIKLWIRHPACTKSISELTFPLGGVGGAGGERRCHHCPEYCPPSRPEGPVPHGISSQHLQRLELLSVSTERKNST